MRRFSVASLGQAGERIALSHSAAHHFVRVLRGAVGQTVEVFDGTGRYAELVVDSLDGDEVWGELGPIHERAALRRCVLVLAVLKGPAMDTAIRMATEAGVAHIQPVVSERSVATGERTDRWSRVAESAAQQCGRADVPTIAPIQKLHEALTELADHTRLIAVPGTPPSLIPHGPVAVFVGPEGGWTTSEVQAVLKNGGHAMSLGPWTLRADTAVAIAVGFAMQNPSDE